MTEECTCARSGVVLVVVGVLGKIEEYATSVHRT